MVAARDIRHRLADLAVDRDAIWFKGYFAIVVSDDLAVLGQHVDDLRFIALGGGGCDVGCDDRVGTDAGARPQSRERYKRSRADFYSPTSSSAFAMRTDQ